MISTHHGPGWLALPLLRHRCSTEGGAQLLFSTMTKVVDRANISRSMSRAFLQSQGSIRGLFVAPRVYASDYQMHMTMLVRLRLTNTGSTILGNVFTTTNRVTTSVTSSWGDLDLAVRKKNGGWLS